MQNSIKSDAISYQMSDLSQEIDHSQILPRCNMPFAYVVITINE